MKKSSNVNWKFFTASYRYFFPHFLVSAKTWKNYELHWQKSTTTQRRESGLSYFLGVFWLICFGYQLHGRSSFVRNTGSAIICTVTLFFWNDYTQYSWKQIPIALKKGCIIEDPNIGTKIMLYHWALYVPLLYLRFVTETPCGDSAITKIPIILTLQMYQNMVSNHIYGKGK